MKLLLRILRWSLVVMMSLIVIIGALLGYLVYTPEPDVPALSGKYSKETILVGAVTRSFRLYVPRGLSVGAPLLVAMHGSGQNGAQFREETGYGFDRLADQHGFVIAYPNAINGYWNVCSIVGAVGDAPEDVGFITALTIKLANDLKLDPNRVFATGVSRGGSMAFRLALEAPTQFRAVAGVSANIPAAKNFSCKPSGTNMPSVMVMNGTDDPLTPFNGGDVSLFGLFYKNGPVRSSFETAKYFAGLNGMNAQPESRETQFKDGVRVTQFLWHATGTVEVELVAIHGGGHSMPQPYRRAPRILGPSPTEPNGPELIWSFFERQAR